MTAQNSSGSGSPFSPVCEPCEATQRFSCWSTGQRSASRRKATVTSFPLRGLCPLETKILSLPGGVSVVVVEVLSCVALLCRLTQLQMCANGNCKGKLFIFYGSQRRSGETLFHREARQIHTIRWLFLMLGFSDSAMATASGVRTYIFHVAAHPSGFSAA